FSAAATFAPSAAKTDRLASNRIAKVRRFICNFFWTLMWRAFIAVLRRRDVPSGCYRSREVSPRPCGKPGRLLAGDLVGERDRVARLRAEIRVRFEVGKHRRDVPGAREPARKNFGRDALERELVPLATQRGDELVEAQEIADQRQMFTAPRKFRMRKRTGHD